MRPFFRATWNFATENWLMTTSAIVRQPPLAVCIWKYAILPAKVSRPVTFAENVLPLTPNPIRGWTAIVTGELVDVLVCAV